MRNQARVHLWFERRFGIPYPALASAEESLTRYPVVVQAIDVRLAEGAALAIAAPFGLQDLFGMVFRPNWALPNAASYAVKVLRARSVWPDVRVEPW